MRLILIRGAVPGAQGSYVKISDAVKLPLPSEAPKPGAFRKLGAEAVVVSAEAPAAEATTNEGGEA